MQGRFTKIGMGVLILALLTVGGIFASGASQKNRDSSSHQLTKPTVIESFHRPKIPSLSEEKKKQK